MRPDTDVAHLRVLVTGASGGLGGATVERLNAQGARVVGTDVIGVDPQWRCDVRDPQAVTDVVQHAASVLGGLNAVINCAGIGWAHRFEDVLRSDDARRHLDVNLLGSWHVAAAALPTLREHHGTVVFVSSGITAIPLPFGTGYVASKSGVESLAEALRLEERGAVRACVVVPGYVDTGIHDANRSRGYDVGVLFHHEPLARAADVLVRACTSRRSYVHTGWSGRLAYALPRSARRLTAGAMAGIVRRKVGEPTPLGDNDGMADGD